MYQKQVAHVAGAGHGFLSFHKFCDFVVTEFSAPMGIGNYNERAVVNRAVVEMETKRDSILKYVLRRNDVRYSSFLGPSDVSVRWDFLFDSDSQILMPG